MFNKLKKENKNKTFYKVTIGYSSIYFTNQEEALAVYSVLSTCVSRITIENRMIDKFNGKDFGGYDYLYHIKRNEEITLGTEEKEISSPEEVEKKVEEVRAAKEAFEAKQSKSKKPKK